MCKLLILLRGIVRQLWGIVRQLHGYLDEVGNGYAQLPCQGRSTKACKLTNLLNISLAAWH